MSVIDIGPTPTPAFVYVVLGIDYEQNDRVIAVKRTYEEAKKYCINSLSRDDEYYDLWIEKHPID